MCKQIQTCGEQDYDPRFGENVDGKPKFWGNKQKGCEVFC